MLAIAFSAFLMFIFSGDLPREEAIAVEEGGV